MRVLVCGGRDFSSYGALAQGMEISLAGKKPSHIIHGGARGADNLAGIWARVEGVEEVVFPADWGKYGKSAGPIRNNEMLTKGCPDLVVAFPGGTGTADMVRRARAAKIRVVEPCAS